MFYNFEKVSKFNPLFTALEKGRTVIQSPKWHPEGSVLNHALQVLNCAFRETKDIDLIIAAMLHDAGKCVSSNGHEEYSVLLVKGLISEKTEWLILNHMRFWEFVLGNMKKLSSVKSLQNHKWLPELVMLARWDKRGRNPNIQIQYDRVILIEKIRQIVKKEQNNEKKI